MPGCQRRHLRLNAPVQTSGLLDTSFQYIKKCGDDICTVLYVSVVFPGSTVRFQVDIIKLHVVSFVFPVRHDSFVEVLEGNQGL